MIQLHLINADTIPTVRRHGQDKSSTLKSFEKWRSPLFGATGNFNHQILPYGILFLTFITTDVFYLLSFKCSR